MAISSSVFPRYFGTHFGLPSYFNKVVPGMEGLFNTVEQGAAANP
jgi:hypothetical protein